MHLSHPILSLFPLLLLTTALPTSVSPRGNASATPISICFPAYNINPTLTSYFSTIHDICAHLVTAPHDPMSPLLTHTKRLRITTDPATGKTFKFPGIQAATYKIEGSEPVSRGTCEVYFGAKGSKELRAVMLAHVLKFQGICEREKDMGLVIVGWDLNLGRNHVRARFGEIAWPVGVGGVAGEVDGGTDVVEAMEVDVEKVIEEVDGSVARV